MTRFAFLGTVDFSARTLAALLDAGAEVAGVLTLPREAATFNADWVDLEPLCRERGVPCLHVRHIGDPEAEAALRSLAPDVLLVFGWSQLVPARVLAIPREGSIGTHPALLPEGRGRHPITWALVEGRTRSGLTLFHLEEGADTGDIVWQRSFPIALEDDAAAVYERVCELGCAAARDLVAAFRAGTVQRLAQDASRATSWRKRTDDDRIIRWEAPTMTTYNLIRGLARPYIGATTSWAGRQLVVLRAAPPRHDDPAVGLPAGAVQSVPGTVLGRSGDRLTVRTGDGTLELLAVEGADAPGPQPGDRLGEAA